MSNRREVTEKTEGSDFSAPRTSLGKRLLEIRKKIVASGEPMLEWEGIEKEVFNRRVD